MYKRAAQGWLKHVDFILLDALCLQAAYMLAYLLRIGGGLPYAVPLYRTLGMMLALVDFLVITALSTMHNVIKRTRYEELKQTVKQCIIVFLLAILWLFSIQNAGAYSRIVLYLTAGLHVIFGYAARQFWKKHLHNRIVRGESKQSLLVVLDSDSAEKMIERLTRYTTESYRVVGAVLADGGSAKEIAGISVVCSLDEAAHYICRKWIDEVFISCRENEKVTRLMEACHQMAVTVHLHMPSMDDKGMKQFVEKFGSSTVLTTSINYASTRQIVLKRAMDILGGLVGSMAALLVIAAVGPKIKKASPGPILYRQERIGKNGRRFKMIKIRSMYLDADERKKELMAQNRVKDGMMFKLEFDPRIIGNEILPDGTKKTGIGEFIRKTSLDEFPQFFNILKGDMSLVGTRPPTVDEWEKYEFHHRARLACKPGLTGMWQVSGRSEITDFEEVVRLDTQYITNWSMALDLKILFKTFAIVLGHKGAM